MDCQITPKRRLDSHTGHQVGEDNAANGPKSRRLARIGSMASDSRTRSAKNRSYAKTLTDWLFAHILGAMERLASSKNALPRETKGVCVVCGVEGATEHNFICDECGDPLAVTMFCNGCKRRLSLDPLVAAEFLNENGYDFEDVCGLVVKTQYCSVCMPDSELTDMTIFRIKV